MRGELFWGMWIGILRAFGRIEGLDTNLLNHLVVHIATFNAIRFNNYSGEYSGNNYQGSRE